MWVLVEQCIVYKDQAIDSCEYLKQAVLLRRN